MTSAPSSSPKPKAPGRRENNKAEKLRRISSAARDLFLENGFDGTTMREIATRADVGFGTLFDYASNKRDLLFLIFNPELETVLEQGKVDAAAEEVLVDRLMALFSGYYTFYARDKSLSRIVLRELNFFRDGSEAEKFIDHRAQFTRVVDEHIGTAIADGQISGDDPAALGRIIFAIYAWEVRRWLATDTTSVASGLAELRALLSFQMTGFTARA